MSMSAGDREVAAGTMARAIYDAVIDELGTGDTSDADREQYRRLSAAIALGVVSHITAEAELRVVISTSDGALQRYNDGRSDVGTLAPSAERQLGGTIS